MNNVYDMSGKKKVILKEIPNVSYKEIMTLIIDRATEEGCKQIFTYGGIDMCPSEVLGDIIDKQKEYDDCNYKSIGCTKCWSNAIDLLEKGKEE